MPIIDILKLLQLKLLPLPLKNANSFFAVHCTAKPLISCSRCTTWPWPGHTHPHPQSFTWDKWFMKNTWVYEERSWKLEGIAQPKCENTRTQLCACVRLRKCLLHLRVSMWVSECAPNVTHFFYEQAVSSLANTPNFIQTHPHTRTRTIGGWMWFEYQGFWLNAILKLVPSAVKIPLRCFESVKRVALSHQRVPRPFTHLHCSFCVELWMKQPWKKMSSCMLGASELACHSPVFLVYISCTERFHWAFFN